MHPVVFKFGWFEIHSYGLLLALSFVIGVLIACYRAQKNQITVAVILDLSIVVIISGIIGARLMYIIFHLDEFRGRWLDTISPVQSNGEIGIAGMTVIGGFVLAIFAGVVYLWRKKQPILKIADLMAPSVALGLCLTRIGCYLQGCCFGLPCNPIFGVVFPTASPAGYVFPNQAIIPTQLYSSLSGFLIFLILLGFARKFHDFDGATFFLLFILYGIARFIIDFFRYYEKNMVLMQFAGHNISANQGVAILLILVFGSLWLRQKIKIKGK